MYCQALFLAACGREIDLPDAARGEVAIKRPPAAIVYMHWGHSDKSEFLSEPLDWAKRGTAVGLMTDASYWRADAPQQNLLRSDD